MVINADKTLIILLGSWNQNTPQAILDSPFIKQSSNIPFVFLGTLVGPNNADSLNWQSIIQKVRSKAASLRTPSLTLNGRILVANSCVTSLTVYPATHTYIPYDSLKALKPILDHFTTPTSKYMSYDDKIKPQDGGGPLVTLLDPLTLCPAQNAKWCYHLTHKQKPLMSQPSWIHPWVHTIFAYGKSNFKLLFLDHILSASYKVNTIKTNVWYDPMIINALKWFKLMKFSLTPNYLLYEECASQHLWSNHLICDPLGYPFTTYEPNSPFKRINSRKLYFVGQLFNNWAPPAWNSDFNQPGITVNNGQLKSNIDLNNEFSPNNPISDLHWNALKLSVQNSPLFTACSSPITPFEPHEFLATLVNDDGTPAAGDVYQLLHNGSICFWERNPDNEFLIERTNQIDNPGVNDYPQLNQLYRTNTQLIDGKTYLIGLKYKIMKSHDSKLQWHKECFYGIPQSTFSTDLKGNKFNEISKSFRQAVET